MTAAPSGVDIAGLPVFPAPRDLRFPLDPAPAYADWRRQEGLRKAAWNGFPVWVVSRYEDITTAMTHPAVSADTRGWLQGEADAPIFPRMDDPEHARLRRMLTKDFTVRRVDAMRPDIERMANDFIDQMIGSGQSADLVRAYALPIPSLVISLLLGVPYDDAEFFQQKTSVMLSRTAEDAEQQDARKQLFGYLYQLVGRKTKEPQDDLISRLITEHLATGDLTAEAVVMNSYILLNAGHETTANMIALGTLALLRHPREAARLRDTDDPAVIAKFVEELLRYLTIVHSLVVRVAKEDVVIGGQLVRAGEGLAMNLPAGNRDAAWTTEPDRFDTDRDVRGHLAFGHGVHQCLGQVLARAELRIALPTLLRRLPGLRLAVPVEELRFREDMSIYGVHELPVAW
jgi:cytochrome P450